MAVDWSELDQEGWAVWAGLHRLLLRLAGQMPDDWVARGRELLATGDLAYLPDTISGSVVELGVSLTPAEVAFLPTVLPAFGQDGEPPAGLHLVRVAEETPATGHRFHPAPPGVLASAGERIPGSLDLTGGGSDELWDLPPELAGLADLADDLTDVADSTAVVLAEGPGVIGVWRAWRFGAGGPPEGGRPVYLVEVEPRIPAWEVAYEVQRGLARKQERPQVEVYWSGDVLTPYHAAARAGSALLWARQPGRVRVAPVPAAFAPDHPRVTDPVERGRLYSALRAGVAVDDLDARGVDAVEPDRGAVVPLTHRTDGRWVWSEAAAYYLAGYGLAPDPELAWHLRAAPPRSIVDGVGVFRAQDALRAGRR